MATRLDPTIFGYQNFYSATLTSDITSGSLTINLDTVPSATEGIIVIEPDSASNREVVLYTSKGASTITIPSDGRGYSGTTATAHLSGSTVIMAPVDKWFTALASGELSSDPLRTTLFYDHVTSGCVWSGDSYASTLNGSMTSGVIYIAGRKLTAATVTAHAFTASKDTYVDASDNGDGTALLTYTAVANNAASPALAANSIRLAIIVSGATNIASAASVNQGQETMVLPIASSIAYSVSDSLGNLICPRDPNRKILGYAQITATASTVTSGSYVDITGLSTTVIVPSGRKVRIKAYAARIQSSQAAGNGVNLAVREGSTTLGSGLYITPVSNYSEQLVAEAITTPTAGTHTYKASYSQDIAGTLQIALAAGQVAFIVVELV